MDIFELLGIQAPAAEKIEKTKKAPEKKQKKPTGTKKKASEESYNLPIKVVTGWREPGEIAGEGKITSSKLQEKIHEMYSEYTAGNMSMQLSGDKKTVYVGFKQDAILAKGSTYLSGTAECRLGSERLDISSVFDGPDEQEVEVTAISDALSAISPVFKGCSIVRSEKEMVVPLFSQPELKDHVMDFPINILFFGRGTFQVTKEQYAIQYASTGEEWDEADGTVSVGALVDLVVEQFKDLDPKYVKLLYDEECHMVLVTQSVPDAVDSKKGGSPKGETYPVDGTALSVIFKQIPLDPSQFGGKTAVSKKELQGFLSGIYPEYSGDNVEFVYNKDNKLIVPILRGSRKGVF